MPYDALATSKTPILIIYLLDVSRSMGEKLGSKTRIEVASEALRRVFDEMLSRSMKGKVPKPRYRVAVYAYSDDVFEVFEGVKTIEEIARIGAPVLSTMNMTNTAAAFAAAERLLEKEIPLIRAADEEELAHDPDDPSIHPAPLVCHMTDGEYNTIDPEPSARRIMQMSVPDGNVLIENIFISDAILPYPIYDLKTWKGVLPETAFTNPYASKLLDMSSPIPHSYRSVLLEMGGYHLAENARMLFPGQSPELVELGFQMSSATRTNSH